MPSLIAVNVLQVVMQYRSGGEIVENTYHVHKGSAWTLTDIGSAISAFESWEATTASDFRSNQVDMFRIVGTDLTSLSSGRIDQQLAVPVIGQDAGGVLPNNVTFAVKANIGERGKGRNGRTFWIGLSEAMVTGSTMLSASADNIQSALNTLITDVSAAVAGASLCVLHTRVGGVPITPAVPSDIQSFTYTDLTTDSQVDRLPGHKRHKRSTGPIV
jgi:hypothetical protein